MARKNSSYSLSCWLQPKKSILFNITNDINSSTRGLKLNVALGGFERDSRHGATEGKNYVDKLLNRKDQGIPAWECSCAPNYYCLSPSAYMCVIPSNTYEPIKCLNATSTTEKEEHMWFFIITYFGTCITLSIYLFPKSSNDKSNCCSTFTITTIQRSYR